MAKCNQLTALPYTLLVIFSFSAQYNIVILIIYLQKSRKWRSIVAEMWAYGLSLLHCIKRSLSVCIDFE